MAKILTTKGSAAELETIIRKAQKDIYLISFSFIISEPFYKSLKNASEKGIIINLIYGISLKTSDSKLDLKKLTNLKIYHFENLHAKLFANETQCIIGSFNFSEVSEIKNKELGVLLTLESDKEAFLEAMDHCKEILNEVNPLTNYSSISSLDSNIEKVNFKPPEIKTFNEYVLNKRYTTTENFIFPSLREKLIHNNPKLSIKYDLEVLTIDKLTERINVELSNRLDFNFTSDNAFEYFKKQNQSTLSKKINFFRIYWNYKCINMYFPVKYEFEITQKELKFQVEKIFEAIQTIEELENKLIKAF